MPRGVERNARRARGASRPSAARRQAHAAQGVREQATARHQQLHTAGAGRREQQLMNRPATP